MVLLAYVDIGLIMGIYSLPLSPCWGLGGTSGSGPDAQVECDRKLIIVRTHVHPISSPPFHCGDTLSPAVLSRGHFATCHFVGRAIGWQMNRQGSVDEDNRWRVCKPYIHVHVIYMQTYLIGIIHESILYIQLYLYHGKPYFRRRHQCRIKHTAPHVTRHPVQYRHCTGCVMRQPVQYRYCTISSFCCGNKKR